MTHVQHGGESQTLTVTDLATRRLRRSEPPGLYDAELVSLASVFCRFTTDAELARAGGDDDLAVRLLAAAHDVRRCIEQACLLDDEQSKGCPAPVRL